MTIPLPWQIQAAGTRVTKAELDKDAQAFMEAQRKLN